MIWYRLFISICAPLFLLLWVWWILTGNRDLRDLWERLGGGHGEHDALWLHGASVGELTSARELLEAFLRSKPGHPVIVTANTTSGRDLAASWGIPGVVARLAPVDLRWVQKRFIRHWHPVALISLENELWPNRFVTCRCPVFCVSARMSVRSAAHWSRVPGLSQAVLGKVTRLFPQDDYSTERFTVLGIPPERLGPVIRLKSGVVLASPDPTALSMLSETFSRHSTVLAASTHPGEEAIVLRAFTIALVSNPDLKLILTPRHPRRGGEVAGLAEAADLTCYLRSRSGYPKVDVAVYVADTLGEMSLWYTLAGITFVGGSLVEKGGHTPFEPARFGSAILHGPHVGNFASAYTALGAAGGATEVTDAESLATGIMGLDATGQAQQADRASATLGALDTSAQDIGRVLEAVIQAVDG